MKLTEKQKNCEFCHDHTSEMVEWFPWLKKCFGNYEIRLGDDNTIGEFLDEFNDGQFSPDWTFIECQNGKYYLIQCQKEGHEINPIVGINCCPICKRDL